MQTFNTRSEELRQSKHWRRRAERAQADAEKAIDRKAKSILRGFAEGYQRVAKRIDAQEKK